MVRVKEEPKICSGPAEIVSHSTASDTTVSALNPSNATEVAVLYQYLEQTTADAP